MSEALKLAETLARPSSVLVVDDDYLIRMVFTRLAVLYEFTLTCVASPEEGISLLEKNNYDFVFLDVKFEGSVKDGMDVLRELNRRVNDAHVIIMSGSVSLADVMHEANRMGVVSFMSKPIEFNVDFLLRILQRLHARIWKRENPVPPSTP